MAESRVFSYVGLFNELVVFIFRVCDPNSYGAKGECCNLRGRNAAC